MAAPAAGYPVAVTQTVTGLAIVLGATIAMWFVAGWSLLWGWLIWVNAAVLVSYAVDGVYAVLNSPARLSPVLYGSLAVLGGTPMGWTMNRLLRRPGPTGVALMFYHALLVVQGVLLAFAVWSQLIRPLF
jgi:hypothetical protein